MNHSALRRAIDIIGSQSRAARLIREWHRAEGRVVKCTQANVWGWLHRDLAGPVPPAEHCRALEAACNYQVTRHELRPDVFGPPDSVAPRGEGVG